MGSWIPRLIIMGLLGVIVGIPLAMRPGKPKITNDKHRLVIISPHNEQIRFELTRAFNEWHRREYGHDVEIDWRVVGGTSDTMRLLTSQYAALAAQGRENEGVGCDLVFGGGAYTFGKLKKGITVGKGDKSRQVSLTQPIKLDPAMISEVYPEAEIAGQPLYDTDGHWWGVVLTSFGIVYNRDALGLLRIDEPDKWEDLADPEAAGWVALADPAHSGSICKTYDIIMQRYGWDKGWKVLRRAGANARYFASSSPRVPLDVGAGEAALGMSIDFYGRSEAQAVGDGRMDYIAPPGETIIDADPIGVLCGAPHKELAERFVKWQLSEEGQLLWCSKKDVPMGPTRYELRRPPIRRDIYDKYLDRMVDKDRPFETARPVPQGTPSYYDVVTIVLQSMAIDIHTDLQAAWSAIRRETNETRKQQMLELFDEMPFDFDALSKAKESWRGNEAAKLQDRLEWTRFFREKYREITGMGS